MFLGDLPKKTPSLVNRVGDSRNSILYVNHVIAIGTFDWFTIGKLIQSQVFASPLGMLYDLTQMLSKNKNARQEQYCEVSQGARTHRAVIHS